MGMFGKEKLVYDLNTTFVSPSGAVYNAANELQGWWQFDVDISSSGELSDKSGNSRPLSCEAANERPAFALGRCT